jgi:hypothetical protein
MSIFDQLQRGWQMGGQMAEQKKKTTLAGLMQQAHGATGDARKNLVGQAIGIDPAAGMEMQKQFDVNDQQSMEQVVNSARLLVGAPEQMRGQLYATQIAPKLKALGFPAPDEYSPEVDQYAQQIAQAWGGIEDNTPAGVREFQMLTKDLPQAERDRALRVQLGLEARAADRKRSLVNVPDGQGGFVQMEYDGENFYRPNYSGATPATGPTGGAAQLMEGSLQNVVGSLVSPLGGRITSTTGGQHNPGSKHYSGDAIDIGMARETPEQQAQILATLNSTPGLRVMDERQRPPGQKVWTGPHLHVERAQGGSGAPSRGGLGYTPPKQAGGPKVPSGYRLAADGQNLEAIPGGPADVAAKARADAAAARKAAEDLKAAQAKQASESKQREASDAALQLVTAIDGLTKSSGFDDLGTAWGDVQIGTPMVRNDAKDANAQLKNIAGQVAIATMARLKALSAQGATGFGALSAPELKLLENSIATLQSEDVSNAQLQKSLKTIRDTMEKVTKWGAQPGAPATNGWSIQRVD